LQRSPISFPATTSKKEFERAPVDLNEAAREVIALSLTDLQRNRVILRTEYFQPFYQQEATAWESVFRQLFNYRKPPGPLMGEAE